MARTKAGATLTAEHHRAQTQLRAQALRDYLQLWPIWRGDEESFNTLVAATLPLIRTYHRLSATVAGAYFESYRRAERAGGDSPPRLAAPLEPERLVASLNVTGRVQTVKALRSGQPLEQAMRTALIRTSGAVARHVQNGGRDTVIESVREDRQAVGWARVLGPSPCAFCLTLASRGAVYKEQTVGFEAHDHCVPAGTLVAGPSVERGFRRWYEGELVIVGLAGGRELAITPNHPVLTERGWVSAGLLREGENVVHRFGADLDALEVPHEDDVPTPIEDVWGAPGMDRLRTVPVAPEDFHGDGAGSQGDVDVVAPYRLLADMLNASPIEFDAEHVRAWAGATAVHGSLAGGGNPALVFLGVGLAASGGVRCCDDCLSALGRQGGGVEAGGLSHATSWDVGLAEPSRDDTARDAVAVGDRLLGLTGHVGIDHARRGRMAVGRRVATSGTRFDPPALEREADRLDVEADLGRRLRERLAGGVELRRVVDLRRIGSWSGHVFNLQTVEGWYAANGIIVSNCNCTGAAVYDGDPQPQSERAQGIYRAAQRWAKQNPDLAASGTSNDAIANVRRYLAHDQASALRG